LGRRVVITGMGAVTPLGTGVAALWDGIRAGRCAIDRISRFDPSPFPCQIAAEVRDFEPERWLQRKEARRMDRFAQFGVACALMAGEDAGLRWGDLDPDRVGSIMGTGIGGMETLIEQLVVLQQRGPDRVSPFFIPMMIANMASAQVSIQTGARGPNLTTVTACASSANAIGEAFRGIARGDIDVAVTGGSEAAVLPLAVAGFCAMKAMSTRNDEPGRACRPFDAGRDGFVLGEGGGALILEELEFARRRGARIRAEVLGYGATADAYDVVRPAPGGIGQIRAMQRAVEEAGLRPDQVDYINAHATSTPVGDREEVQAIKTVFGAHAARLPVSSTKSMTGHLLGAAGAVELIISVLALQEGCLPPTINLDQPDPECDLDAVPNVARPGDLRVALSNSFGFGGHNVSLLVRRWDGA
jgi:3-oxoacyl-[acyl-carrier-protein] synthase II